ncbi:MAG: hypothetical protein Q4G33_03895 [bacterium]|nr:hypothetical protein [bacterium]
MCRHKRIKINDVDVCLKCGLTVCEGKFVQIDRKLISKIGKKVK